MGDNRAQLSEVLSEERTEPFSQSEFDSRVRSIRVGEPSLDELHDTIPLNLLKVEDHHHRQGIRLLVRPLTSRSVSPGNGSCQWLVFKADVRPAEGQEEDTGSEQALKTHYKVLAVTQTSKDIKFSVRIPADFDADGVPTPPIWCELYYDPASDNQVLLNRSEIPITLTRLESTDPVNDPDFSYEIKPVMTKLLSPGSWRISIGTSSVLDFRVLRRMPATLMRRESSNTDMISINSSGKRSLSNEDLTTPASEKKPKVDGDRPSSANGEDGVLIFVRPNVEHTGLTPASGNNVHSRDLVLSNGSALIDVAKDETVEVQGNIQDADYSVTKRDQIASTSLSTVYTATYSEVPGGIVTVKVLRTRSNKPNTTQKPQEAERNVIRQADMWEREYQSQSDLQHDSIVRLYDGDARFLSLYMEHVDARDLASRPHWRSPQDDNFLGGPRDAARILCDVSSALNYLHSRRLVHNDIKPANILYSRERGAVLCDFGLSTTAGGPATTGGTPYYVPPEFMGGRQRGAPSDVWALGVTMLYVLRKLSFPDARMRPPPASSAAQRRQPLYWMIADVNRPAGSRPRAGGPGAKGMSAVDQMKAWLNEVREAANKLEGRSSAIERLVHGMLIPNPNQRITTAEIVKELTEILGDIGGGGGGGAAATAGTVAVR